ncbi:MAG: acyl-CoA dehydrogenase family protein [Hyphomonadaceae bacterium]
MALSYTSEQEQIRNEARRFLHDRFDADVQRDLLRRQGAFDTRFWQDCIDMSWTGAGAPEAYGGLGLGPLDVCIIAEECGRFVAGAPFPAANYAVITALVEYGDEAQRAALIPGIVSGDIRFALALFEDEDGLPAKPKTVFSNGVLNGRKIAAAGAAAATHALVSSDTGLVLTDLSAGGVKRVVVDAIDNSRCAADLNFRNVPGEALAAGADALRILAVQAMVTAFEQIGGAEAVMAKAQLYANTREAFGQLIGRFQAIKHRIAEMYVAIELARGNALVAATGLAESAADFVARSAAARLTASAAFEFAAAESIQTHGAIGVTWEHDLHLYLRRARALALELGSPLYWEDVVVDAIAGA